MKIYCHIIFYFFLIGNISCTTSKKTIKNKDSKNIVSKQESRIKKLLIEGTTEKIIGNLNEADSLFKMCLTIAPKNAVCFYELSGISLQKNEIEDGPKAFGGNHGMGASMGAIWGAAKRQRYTPVASTVTNLILVRDDLVTPI